MKRHTAERSRKRRAIRAGVVAMKGITKKRVYERDNGLCVICGNWTSWADATIDHLYPISRGGPHTLANVGVAHSRCNKLKADRTLLELEATGVRDKLRKGIFA